MALAAIIEVCCPPDSCALLRKLLQLIPHLGDAGLRAGFLHGLATRGPAQADRADCLFTDHDRNTAAERNDIRETALTGYVAFGGAFRPVGGSSPERQCRIGLAAGEFEIVGRRSIALEKYAQPAGAIENRHRYSRRAFSQRGFCDHQGHLDRNGFLGAHLCSCRRGCSNECRQTSHEAQSNRHRTSLVITRAVHGRSRPRPRPDYVTPAEQEIRTKLWLGIAGNVPAYGDGLRDTAADATDAVGWSRAAGRAA